MKLSEAIRLGSLLKPQAYGPFEDEGSCALAASMEAIGLARTLFGGLPYKPLREAFPILKEEIYLPSMSGLVVAGDVMGAIFVLNDTAHWTREKIADWVEELEKQAETAIVVDKPEPQAV